MPRARIIWLLTLVCVALSCGAAGWVAFRTWQRTLNIAARPWPTVRFEHGKMIVPLPSKALLAEVGRLDDELSAYLWFDYLWSRSGVDESQVLLTVTEKDGVPAYRVLIALPNDAVTAIPFLANSKPKASSKGSILCSQPQSKRNTAGTRQASLLRHTASRWKGN